MSASGIADLQVGGSALSLPYADRLSPFAAYAG
jgi:hypothetical protein